MLYAPAAARGCLHCSTIIYHGRAFVNEKSREKRLTYSKTAPRRERFGKVSYFLVRVTTPIVMVLFSLSCLKERVSLVSSS
jgi:predicted nucleic acid-binding Zn ribbon protein